jgi:hypothetical protein
MLSCHGGSSIAVSVLLGAIIVLNPEGKSSPPVAVHLSLGFVATIYLIFNVFMLLYDQSGGVAWPSRIFLASSECSIWATVTKEKEETGGSQEEEPNLQGRRLDHYHSGLLPLKKWEQLFQIIPRDSASCCMMSRTNLFVAVFLSYLSNSLGRRIRTQKNKINSHRVSDVHWFEFTLA